MLDFRNSLPASIPTMPVTHKLRKSERESQQTPIIKKVSKKDLWSYIWDEQSFSRVVAFGAICFLGHSIFTTTYSCDRRSGRCTHNAGKIHQAQRNATIGGSLLITSAILYKRYD